MSTHWERLHRDDQGGQLNHEDLLDYIREYVGSTVAWTEVTAVTIVSDGTVRVDYRSTPDAQQQRTFKNTHYRMRDEAHQRDRENLGKLGKR